MHLDLPGGRPSNQKPHKRLFHPPRGSTATQTKCGQWRNHWPLLRVSFPSQESGKCFFFLKTHKRYVTSMILVGVGQDQTYPSLMKECKQLSSRWCESEWSNVAWTLNVHHPHAGKDITPSTLYYPTNFILIFKSSFSLLYQDSVVSWQGRWYKNSRQAVTLARMETPMPCSDDS